MASTAHTTRRSLFSMAAGAAILTAPMAASAAPTDDWGQLIAGLVAIHPALQEPALKAKAEGYHPDELITVFIMNDGDRPFLIFRREFGESPGPRTYYGPAQDGAN